MKKIPFFLWMIIGFVPFFTKVPYMLTAWQNSRLDRNDWIFAALFLLLFTITIFRIRKNLHMFNFHFLWIAAIGLSIYAIGLGHQINAASIIGGIITAWAAVGVCCGKNWAYILFPVFSILILSCTSTTYWIEYYTNFDGFLIKIGCAILLSMWSIWDIVRKKAAIPVLEALFIVAIIALMLFYFITTLNFELFPGFTPQLGAHLNNGTYLGCRSEISALDRRFFGKSTIERYYFADDGERYFNILIASNIESATKIHPAGHCLKTAGLNVISNKLTYAAINGQRLQFNEIVVDYKGQKMLFFAWYSNKSQSSGNFLSFRKSYQPDENWRTYQISTPVFNNDLEAARTAMINFLSSWE